MSEEQHQGTPDVASREHTRYWAEFWGVTMRTIQRWKKERLQVDNVDHMMRWGLGRQVLPDGFRAKVDEIRMRRQREPGSLGYDLPGITDVGPAAAAAGESAPAEEASPVDQAEPPKPLGPDPDYKEFLNQARDRDGAESKDLEHWRDYYEFKLQKAAAVGDRAEVRFCEERFMKFEEAIRKNRLLAARLGLDTGDLMSREAVEQMVRAIASRLNAGIHILINDLPEKLVGLTFPEEVADRLEDGLLRHGLMLPFAKAAGQASNIGLPKWLVEIMRDAIDDHIEEGAREFDEAAK